MILYGLAVSLVCILSVVAPAYAADSSGQYEGIYVLGGSLEPSPHAAQDALQLKCVLAPGVMKADGSGVAYYLDRELFRATGEISYIKGQEYKCRYTPATKMETCSSKEFTDGKSLSYYRSNVYQVFTPDLQQGHSLLSPEDVAAWKVRGELNPANRFAYHRCTCITASEIESRASSKPNELSTEESGKLLYWRNADPTLMDYDLARQVIGLSGRCKPNLS